MAKIRIVGLEKELKRTKLRIGNAIKRSGFEKQMKEDVAKEIRSKGLKPELSGGYITQRGKLAQYNSTHPDYVKGKSNLTFTGELLNKMNVKYIASKLVFIFGATGRHKKIKTKSGTSGGNISNKELLEFQNKTRPILQVFDNEGFAGKIERKLISAIKRFFK